MKIQLSHRYEDIVSIENLLLAWQEFLSGKRAKHDVQKFSFRLMDNILALHEDLRNGTYCHGPYYEFKINDPKPRIIHKASVRDRLLHHAIYRILYPFFEKTFIADSYSCRIDKGTHKAINRFREFSRIVSKNNTRTCWVLKCDIKKFFHSIDQVMLTEILESYILDKRIISLLSSILESFHKVKNRGLPLGNLTSQLFCNVYMNRFDQFVKHKLKAKYYIRYADDFVVLSDDREYLQATLSQIESFLQKELHLQLHPDKISIKTLASGVDFLGWINFFDHRVIRTTTKRRMMKRLNEKNTSSYMGLLGHGNMYKVRRSTNCFLAGFMPQRNHYGRLSN